jgi:hypothetical protein
MVQWWSDHWWEGVEENLSKTHFIGIHVPRILQEVSRCGAGGCATKNELRSSRTLLGRL